MKDATKGAEVGIDLTEPGFPNRLGRLLATGVREIDRSCDHLIKGVESGLCNVKTRFAAEAYEELEKKLTEETLTSWLLQKQLQRIGFRVEAERFYPATRQECDLVLIDGDKASFWIEVKYAWKKWCNCDGTVGRSSSFKGYLLGDFSHPGTAHDFRKLLTLFPDHASQVGLLLIGLDSVSAPMDSEISLLIEQQRLHENGWQLSHHESWPDRRNETFRINCWFWSHSGSKPHARVDG
jgi:hypothetical protein